MDLLEANTIAQEVFHLLACTCERIDIAGSIKRREHFIGDIEIVCLPKSETKIIYPPIEAKSPSLFPDEMNEPVTGEIVGKEKIIVDQEFIDIVNSWTKIKGEPIGRYTQRLLPNKVKLDLFMPTKSDYFRQLAIRTGDANYSRFVIATGWKRQGWCGTEDGLRRIDQCDKKNNKWKCIVLKPILPPEWNSEKEFFDFLDVKMLPPQYRIINQNDINKIYKNKY